MKKIYAFLLMLVLTVSSVHAQYQKVSIDPDCAKKHQVKMNAMKSGPQLVSVARSSNIVENLPEWNANLTGFAKIHELPPNVEKEVADKTAQKIRNRKTHYPEEPSGSVLSNPVLGASFAGNVFSGMTPPDNSMAISNAGVIVSVVNSTLEYYNTGGTLLYSSSFTNFFNDPGLAGMLYDPVVLYDSGSDRFFMVILSTTSSTTSEVVCCFSKTNNPADGWWYYKLTGNPLNNGCWFDYPRIGVSNNEVYVTGNLFLDAGTFSQATIYQVKKTGGYNGAALEWQYWTNITNTPFTLVPASYGQSGNYGPGIYFVSTEENNNADKIYLYDLTNDMGSAPAIDAYTTDATFNVAGNALQSGSAVVLNTDDTRVFSAFYLNGILHFVFHSERSSNYNGVNYHRLTLASMTDWNSVFGLDGYDYCYPSVASFGSDNTNKSVMIAFVRSGSDIFPETRVVYYDDAGNNSSSTLVKAGESFVDVYQNSGVTRWGDYTGISRKQNSSTPVVWLSGSYGAFQAGENAQNTWIAQVTGINIGIPVLTDPGKRMIKVFPNPAADKFSLEFSVDKRTLVEIMLNDASGKMVKLLMKDVAEEGKNLFSFNKGVLSSGIYFVQIRSGNKIIANEKMVIE